MQKLFFSLILLGCFSLAHGQSILTKSEAVQRAKESGLKVKLADNNIQTAAAKYKQTNAIYLPQLSMDYTGVITNSPMNAFGFKLNQKSITQNDFMPDLLNHPKAIGNFTKQATLLQPIFNADMLAMREAAQKQIAIAGFQKQRTQDYLAFSAEMEYNQLQLSYEMVTVSNEALQMLRAIYKWTKDRYDQGYVQKSDLLNVEVNVKSIETQVATAKSAVQEHADNLSVLMDKSLGSNYQVDTLALENNTTTTNELPADRADFKAMETAISAYDDMQKSTKRSFIPSVNGFATYQLNDKHAWGFGNGNYMAGIQLKWNVFDGNQRNSKLATQKLEQQQIALQLEDQKIQDTKALAKANQQLHDADYQLAQYRAAVAQAQEALVILQNRYKQGLVSTTDILQAQTQLSQQKLYYKQAVMMHNSTLAYIKFLVR